MICGVYFMSYIAGLYMNVCDDLYAGVILPTLRARERNVISRFRSY